MAKKQEGGKRTLLVAVDGSEHSERAFDCKFETLRDFSYGVSDISQVI